MSLLETDVPIRNVVTTGPAVAKALDNDVRAKILDLLADEAMTVTEIRAGLERRGDDKAVTTVRHHVDVLEDAGLIELARLEEASGGTRKYYESNTRVFSYDLPAGSDERLSDVQNSVREPMAELLEQLVAEHGDELEAVAREMKPCEYCETQRYEEFILREVVNRALTDLSEDGTIEALRSSASSDS